MEVELEPRVKPLPYRVKAMSRESPSQKAVHVLDTDLRSHWSTATNTKEWILLELDEPCLLSHTRIYNKSVLEWEIAVGLRYKPETFVKVRPRCEAPRRDMIYPMNYTPCRYVRISCLRGNPIAIFFIQLIGVSVTGLEPEFLPVVNYLLPHIISQKLEPHDMHLQLLQDMTNRLLVFLPQLEADLTSFPDAAESNLRFLAMLAGPFYPILHVVNERAAAKSASNNTDPDVSKNCQLSSSLTVSSNFEPRRSRGVSPFSLSSYSAIAFRPDAIFTLLRKAYKDSDLGSICRMASRIVQKLIGPHILQNATSPRGEIKSVVDESETPNLESSDSLAFVDYSNLFGEEFRMPDEHWDYSYLNILDIGSVEEGILHVLYACASQPLLCSKLAERTSDFWSALPLVQALLPALRPCASSPYDIVDETFSQWKQPVVQQALSQIVATTSSQLYRPLLHACAGYLSSFSPSHARAACVLIDLCSGVLAPWMPQVIAKVYWADVLCLTVLNLFQGSRHSLVRARSALKYIVLSLSGNVDDILGKYKEVKHRILFLLEMLEPFLDPAITASKSTIAFGDLSSAFPEKQEKNCAIALNIIRTAVRKPAVLPSLESEWRHGSVAPSVLLSILEPHMQLPPEIDLLKPVENEPSSAPFPSVLNHGSASSKSNNQDETDGKIDTSDTGAKVDVEDRNLLFAPPELQNMALSNFSSDPNWNIFVSKQEDVSLEPKQVLEKKSTNQFPTDLVLDTGLTAEFMNLQADYFQLVNYRDCELLASEFQRLALDLHAQNELTVESHDAAIDALLLAAECYVNPFFMLSFRTCPNFLDHLNINGSKTLQCQNIPELRRVAEKSNTNLDSVARLERKRDKFVLQLLLEAAELDRKYHNRVSDAEDGSHFSEGFDDQVTKLSSLDIQSADAVTLSLVFLLHSATKLYCTPEHVIDTILRSAEDLNRMLASFHHQSKGGNFLLTPDKIHGVQRRWMLLQKLVIASSSGVEGADFAINVHSGYRCGNLIPPSAWMHRISYFSSSASPLVRFFGWMAISRNAEQYIKDRVFLAADLSQLTYLLDIFADDLAFVDNVVNQKYEVEIDNLGDEHGYSVRKGSEGSNQRNEVQSFHVLYPDLSMFFPNMKKQFESFGEIILEAVGLQLRSVSSMVVPDVLCWFSDLCSKPFSLKEQNASQNYSDNLKGYNAKNARAIILYILEAIVSEHMEALVPEIPKVVEVLQSLSGSSYCDVSFLESILCLLKPIISYSLSKVSDEERSLVDDTCCNFEELCFDALFNNIRQKSENQDGSADKIYNRALTIFILASVFPDLSIHHKRELLQSLVVWAGFAAFELTNSFYDYLSAFQCVMDSCKVLIVQTLRVFGVVLLQLPPCPTRGSLESHSWFLSDVCHTSCQNEDSEMIERYNSNASVNRNACHLSSEDIEGFSDDVEALITKLTPTIEICWNFHHQLAKKLTIVSAECYVLSRCLSWVAQKNKNAEDDDQNSSSSKSVDQFELRRSTCLEGLADIIMMLQESSCWEVSSVMLDCLLGVPDCFLLDKVIGTICSAIKNISSSAPKIVWRLQSDKWLSALIARGIHNLQASEVSLIDLFCTLLGHPEPEQRFIALKHLGELVGQCVNGRTDVLSSKNETGLLLPNLVLSVSESVLSQLVSSTWDEVIVLAASDASLTIRLQSMALLLDYIPFAEHHQLQSFLAATDSLRGLSIVPPSCEGPILQLSLALIASACLYSPAEDISLIPENVWRNIDILGSSKHGGRLGDLEKRACQVLCRLRNEGDEAKEVLKEVLIVGSPKQHDPNFGSTRESILQVLANLSSVHSYFDIFSKKIEQDMMELEEAEMELDILRKEHALQESANDSKDGHQIPFLASSGKDETRLQQIRDCIHSLEKSKLQEDIIARRQKKIIVRRARQKCLEEAALREAQLLQELDREREFEMERELERQRLLELERAKTRELRHHLDMEKERQAQKELQREVEQVESGMRPSRRDFSSSAHSSRPRERFRERENGRSGIEGGIRTGGVTLQPESSTPSSSLAASPAILSGSRPFSGQLPTILQSRDRQDECGSLYEENLDGSKDSGDTNSVGDPDLVSPFDGQSGGYGSSQRHGSRSNKSRQVGERRERDSRREGKWERKHS
ncbi:Galactose-binding domain-like, Armadillo-type fold protein [Quillaja saponaria]|uniref:Galactose-binding domain-like, Armadillo-type fold protein n=1 Tax=Quillaja saponaria TaxID=32244 RepID=A0AAD7L3F2_QUISA|nr:Galactose-binding domain-like, Armadillo-type fold protein [Quillaja saponaria]